MSAAPHHVSVTTSMRSTKMYSMQEALAREHMSELRRQASHYRAAREARAERRYRRLQRLARSAHDRVS